MIALKLSRKADREAMAEEIGKLIVAHGAHFQRLDPKAVFPGDRCIMLQVVAGGGVMVSISFDGRDIHKGGFLLSWHMVGNGFFYLGDGSRLQPGRKLRPGPFPMVNEYHYRKATDFAHDYDRLKVVLARRLDAIRDGSAFQPMTALDRAFEQAAPVVNSRNEPLDQNWKPKVCPRYAAHSKDQELFGSAPLLKKYLSPEAYRFALAFTGCDDKPVFRRAA